MRFSALREDLLEAVQAVQYSANAKGMMPILSGIRINASREGLVLYSTDLESYTITTCPSNVGEEGVGVVNHKIFMDFLRDSRDEKMDVELVGNEMFLKGENTVFKLFTMPAEDFPNAPVVEIPIIEDLECSVILPSIHKVSKAASRDEKRPTLMGMFLEVEEDVLKMVCTDSYRLAIRKVTGGFKTLESGKYIIPSSAMLNLSRIMGKAQTIKVFRDENRGQVRFDVGETSYIIRLIEGKFPKYDQFIPESLDKVVKVGKEDVLGALKRASLISSTMRLNVGSGDITLVSESREVGEGKEVIAAECDGEEMSIAFNGRFLEDGITSIDGDTIVLGMTEPLKPGIIREKEGDDFVYIIMPIRI